MDAFIDLGSTTSMSRLMQWNRTIKVFESIRKAKQRK
mgnify:FL=1